MVVTDAVTALRKVVKKYFPNVLHISCYFHYMDDIFRNLRKYGLYKNTKKTSDKILALLSELPIVYNGNLNYIDNRLNRIIENYPEYTNYINNYFKKYKIPFFKDESLNYYNIPKN